MNVDGRRNVEGDAVMHSGHSARNIPLDKLKALLLSKAELILSTLSDSILSSVASGKGEHLLLHAEVLGLFSFSSSFFMQTPHTRLTALFPELPDTIVPNCSLWPAA